MLILFCNSSKTNAEGGNGKSLVQKAVTKIRKHTFVDGKKFRNSASDGSRFNFSSVTLDTQFVWIDCFLFVRHTVTESFLSSTLVR